MVKFALLGASALVVALGAVSASAEPTTQQLLRAGQKPGMIKTFSPNARLREGRAAAIEGQGSGSIIIEQHRGRG